MPVLLELLEEVLRGLVSIGLSLHQSKDLRMDFAEHCFAGEGLARQSYQLYRCQAIR